MYKITCKITLEGINEETVRLKIKRGSGFWVNECFYHKYRWDEFGTYLDVDSYIYDGDLSNIEMIWRRALSNIERSNKMINFLFGAKIINEYPNHYNRDLETVSKIPATPLKSSENINRIHNFICALNNIVKSETKKARDNEDKLRKKYYAAINYCIRSLDAIDADLYEDALLSIYRGVEILAREKYKTFEQEIINNFRNKFSEFLDEVVDETYGERHRQLFEEFKPLISKKLMTDTRKILKSLRELKIFSENDLLEMKNLCDVRNSLSHGNTEENEISIDLLAKGLYVLRSIIAIMILDKKLPKAYPFADLVH
ncbi:hypothetical protein C1N83_27935 (plasmid) [Priestia aryabhattai]